MRHLTSYFEPRIFVKKITKFDEVVFFAEEILILNEHQKTVLMQKKFDTLVSYLLKNFDGEISAPAVREVLVNPDIDGLDSEVLSNYSPYLVPIIVIRELLYKNRINVDPRKAKNWHKFFDKYYKTILAA